MTTIQPTMPASKPRSRAKTPLIAVAAGILGFVIGAASASAPDKATTTSVSSTPASTVTVTATAVPVPADTVTVTAKAAAPAAPAGSITSDGTFLVGADIKPGTYKSAGGDTCYWARLKDLSGSGIIDNGIGAGQQVVTVQASDKAFETRGCGEWRRVS